MSDQSKKSNRGALLFFLFATLASLVVLVGLTADTHRQVDVLTHADKLSEQVVAGKHAFQKYNCNDCHTILGIGGYYAPDLTKAVWRRGLDGTAEVIQKPEVVLAASTRKMPNLKVTAKEAADITAFLEWTANIDTHDWPPQDKKLAPSATVRRLELAGVSRGGALFKDKGCIGCHQIGGVGGSSGPALDNVGAKLDEASIEKWILDPQAQKPDTQMPNLGLTHEEAEALGVFLAKQKARP